MFAATNMYFNECSHEYIKFSKVILLVNIDIPSDCRKTEKFMRGPVNPSFGNTIQALFALAIPTSFNIYQFTL